MKNAQALLWAALAAAGLGACVKRPTAPQAKPDYDSVRRHSQDAHQSLDEELAKPRE